MTAVADNTTQVRNALVLAMFCGAFALCLRPGAGDGIAKLMRAPTPVAKQVCPNPDCKCQANGGECFCAELGPGGCECKAEPPAPAPLPPPGPNPDVLPGELDPPKPKPPKTESPLCQCDAGGTPCKCTKCECGLAPLPKQIALHKMIIVHGNKAAFDAAYAEWTKHGWTVAWENVTCVNGVCPQTKYTVEFQDQSVQSYNLRSMSTYLTQPSR